MGDEHHLLKLLSELEGGDRQAFDQLLPLVYDELHALASRMLSGRRRDTVFQSTVLVHETYLKVAGRPMPRLESVGEFLALTARVMRQVLVDHSRRRNAEKRGGGRRRVSLGDLNMPVPAPGLNDLVALDSALCELEEAYERCGKVVELRIFVGLTVAEVAQILGVTKRTVERDWRFALAYLLRSMRGASPPSTSSAS